MLSNFKTPLLLAVTSFQLIRYPDFLFVVDKNVRELSISMVSRVSRQADERGPFAGSSSRVTISTET